jgi:hypothetical protein
VQWCDQGSVHELQCQAGQRCALVADLEFFDCVEGAPSVPGEQPAGEEGGAEGGGGGQGAEPLFPEPAGGGGCKTIPGGSGLAGLALGLLVGAWAWLRRRPARPTLD